MPAILPIPEEADVVLISVNPRAGGQNRQGVADELSRELKAVGLEGIVVADLAELRDLAAERQSSGKLRAVVAAGGDGTVSLIANSIPPGVPIAVLPLGTENLLAKYLELSADPRRLAQLIAAGCSVPLDAGAAGDRLFILMAGCGFDAEVVRRLHRRRTGNIHHLSYAKPILDAIRKYNYPELRVQYAPAEAGDAGELTESLVARWVFVVNLPRYAGGLRFAPGASGTDGLLDVCTFKAGSLWNGLLYLGGVMLGQHEGMSDFVRVQTARLRIESAAPAPLQLDGDPGGDLPVDIRVLSGRLRLIASQGWAEKLGFTTESISQSRAAI
jgi:diacylglycerol kinase family enzyme